MTPVLVDTDVLSYMFKGDSRAPAFGAYLQARRVFYSFQTDAELQVWMLDHNWGAQRRERFQTFLEPYVLVQHDADISRRWAEVMHQSRQAGRRMLAADAWIAATALEVGVPLVTHNAEDFAGLSSLDIISL